MRPRPPGRTRDLPGSDGLLSCVMGSSTTAERRRLAVTAPPLLPSALSTASASAICNFRGSIAHPTRSLCMLRNRRHRRSRNTRYRAGATPYLGWTSTGWITSASPDALTVYWIVTATTGYSDGATLHTLTRDLSPSPYVPLTRKLHRNLVGPAEVELSPNFGDGLKDQAAAWA